MVSLEQEYELKRSFNGGNEDHKKCLGKVGSALCVGC
jgi:hypothetical protein